MTEPRTRLTLLLRPAEAAALSAAAARRWQRPSDYARALVAAALARKSIAEPSPPQPPQTAGPK